MTESGDMKLLFYLCVLPSQATVMGGLGMGINNSRCVSFPSRKFF